MDDGWMGIGMVAFWMLIAPGAYLLITGYRSPRRDETPGRIFPEYGPNMMWTTKYGHDGMMGGWSQPTTGEMPIDEDEAVEIAQDFLDSVYPGTVADGPRIFYGYYTLHVAKEGEIYGMLTSTATMGSSGITTGTAPISRVGRYIKGV